MNLATHKAQHTARHSPRDDPCYGTQHTLNPAAQANKRAAKAEALYFLRQSKALVKAAEALLVEFPSPESVEGGRYYPAPDADG